MNEREKLICTIAIGVGSGVIAFIIVVTAFCLFVAS